MIEILPALDSLTVCDSTSAIASNKSALRVAKVIDNEYLHSFGTIELTDQIITDVEIFLVKCILYYSIDCFEELRHKTYCDNLRNFLQQVRV